MSLFVDSVPYLSFPSPHQGWVNALVVLDDGSFVSCSTDHTVKRWMIDDTNGGNENKSLRLVGTYLGHQSIVNSAAEMDNNTFVTCGFDSRLKVWNKTTCEPLHSLETVSRGFYLMRTKDKTRIVCGMSNGLVEMRRIGDLGVISSFKVHSKALVCICELEDGSFVSRSEENIVKRWDGNGTLIQNFLGSSTIVMKVIQLNSNVIVVSSRDKTVTIWKVSTGQLLHKLTFQFGICGLVKLSNDKFVMGSWDGTLGVWNGMNGERLETVSTDYCIEAMTRLGESLVTANKDRIEVRIEVRAFPFLPSSYRLVF